MGNRASDPYGVLFSKELSTSSPPLRDEVQDRRLTEESVIWANISPQTRQDLLATGVVLGEVLPDDPLLQRMALPSGWRRVADAAPRKILLLDEKGRRRVLIRRDSPPAKNSVVVLTRISIVVKQGARSTRIEVRDGETVLHSIQTTSTALEWEVYKKAMSEAERWTFNYFPAWSNRQAYWEVNDLTTLIK